MSGSDTALTKVTIKVYEGPDKDQTFVALLNPSSYTLSRTNRLVTSQPVNGDTVVRNVVTEIGSFKLELWLDATGACGEDIGDLQARLAKFRMLMKADTDLHRPARLLVTWDRVLFTGFMTEASEQFTLFDRGGHPLRVKLACTFTSPSSNDASRNASPDLHRVHRVVDSDRVDLIAHTAYQDGEYWSAIARRNRVANPRALRTGADLVLPRLDRRR